MANRREEERERLRQARSERETKQASGLTATADGSATAAPGMIGLAVLVGVVVVIISSVGGSDSGNAHIDQATGSTATASSPTNGPAPSRRRSK